jgi:L-ascorbate metabolism protein UlaG (beta-lactamase superfamily)
VHQASATPDPIRSAARALRAPASPGPRALSGLTVTWLGHATAVVEMDGARVITDPALRKRMGPLVRVAPPVDPEKFANVDAVLLSHLHSDHADLPSLRLLGKSVPVLAPTGSGAWLEKRGIGPVEEIAPGGHTTIGPLTIDATSADHDARRKPLGPSAEPVGFIVRGSHGVYFAGDTDVFPEMAHLAGAIDIALLPIWGWGSSIGPGHLDPDRAAHAAEMVAAQWTVPIHWGTYALARPLRLTQPKRPPREWAPNRFAEMAARHGATRVAVLEPGEQMELSNFTSAGST